jgi:hypothetical protein
MPDRYDGSAFLILFHLAAILTTITVYCQQNKLLYRKKMDDVLLNGFACFPWVPMDTNNKGRTISGPASLCLVCSYLRCFHGKRSALE